MFERLLKIIKETMPDADVSDADENSRLIEDLGFDSIGLMMLAMALEDEFGVRFTNSINFVTVKDVINYLEKHATK
ncbi:MAG TPA: acyl carrier protein [Firmicutes bacterium]|nr:acyl carrier protein [Bacillota bacterium]